MLWKLEKNAVHFYGNDGVCLFKYLVRSDDPKRSRTTSDAGADMFRYGNIVHKVRFFQIYNDFGYFSKYI